MTYKYNSDYYWLDVIDAAEDLMRSGLQGWGFAAHRGSNSEGRYIHMTLGRAEWQIHLEVHEATPELLLGRWGIFDRRGFVRPIKGRDSPYVYGPYVREIFQMADYHPTLEPHTPEGDLLFNMSQSYDFPAERFGRGGVLRTVGEDDPWSKRAVASLCQNFGLDAVYHSNAVHDPWWVHLVCDKPEQDVLPFTLLVPRFEEMSFKLLTGSAMEFDSHEDLEQYVGRYRRLKDLYITMQRSVR